MCFCAPPTKVVRHPSHHLNKATIYPLQQPATHKTMTDSLYSYVHFTHPNQSVFMENWKDFSIPYDDIDVTRLFDATANIFPQFLLDDEEDGAIPLNSSIFGAKVSKNRSALQKTVWSDLNLDPLRADSITPKLPDKTILKSLHFGETDAPDVSLSDFLSNGYNSESFMFNPDQSVANISHDDIWLHTTSEFGVNHTFSNIKPRSNSTTHAPNTAPVLTPKPGRTRQPSHDKLQTPITRILR